MKNVLLMSAVGLTVVLMSGCDFTTKFCERAVDCMGEELAGTVDQCVSASNAAADAAEADGCGAEYDDAAACSYKNSECTDSVYTYASACDAEATAYVECMTAAATGSEKLSVPLDPFITIAW